VQFRNSDKYAVVKGKQYVATFKAKASTALNCKFRMENTTDFERALPLTDSWQNFSFTTNGMDKTGFMNIIFGLGNPVPAGASIDIDDIEIYEKRFDLEIGASETHDAADFATTNYWNITFSSDASGTAQLSNIPAEGITVGGVVKIKKTFTDAKWYAVGFPFAIAEIRSNHASYPVLSAWNGTEGDFWAKTYNGASDEFNDYAGSALPAGGYAIQFPPVLLNQEITFVSAPDVILNNSSQWNVAASGYKLAANPSVANTTVSASDADKYYILDLNKPANFGLLTAGTHDLQPFESVVVANGIETAALRSSLNIETITGIHETPASDAIKEVRYYNLQGLEIPATAHSAGVVIVKTVYQSGAVSLSKILRK
jgi:hypothetical protein